MVGDCTMLQNDLIIYTIGSFNYQAKLGSIKKNCEQHTKL